MILTSLSNNAIYLTDRTTIENDWECGMKRWWYKEEGGTGIVPREEAAYYLVGREIHEDFSRIAKGEAWETIVDAIEWPAQETYDKLEPIARRVGWAVAYGQWGWPTVINGHDVVMVERELVLERPPLWVACTADLVLRRRTDGKLIVPDYKSVGLLGKEWVNHWPYAIQMHINIIAVEEEMGEKSAGGYVIGLLKGKEEKGKLRHPYVWAYSNGKGAFRKEWTRDWALTPTWEYGSGGKEGVVQYVLAQGEEEALGQFPRSAPFMPDTRLVASVIDSRIEREKEVATWRKKCATDPIMRSLVFEQRFSKCRPAFGSPCAYLSACHNATINADPLGSGEYVPRTPHHEIEIIGGQNE